MTRNRSSIVNLIPPVRTALAPQHRFRPQSLVPMNQSYKQNKPFAVYKRAFVLALRNDSCTGAVLTVTLGGLRDLTLMDDGSDAD